VTNQPKVPGSGPSEDEVEPVAEPPTEGAQTGEVGSAAADDERARLPTLGLARVLDVKVPSFGPTPNFAALFPKIELPDLSAIPSTTGI
jgi:hypothetical protein